MPFQPRLAFSLDEYAARLARARQAMSEQGLDVLLVHHFPNICYLSGLQSFNCGDYALLAVPAAGEPALVVYESEYHNAALSSWLPMAHVHATPTDPGAVSIEVLSALGLAGRRVGIEMDAVHAGDYARLTGAFPKTDFVSVGGLVQRLRARKSPAEIATLRRSAAITSIGMQAALEAARPGVPDYAIAGAAHGALVGAGSEYMAVQPVVCAGVVSGVRHGSHRGVIVSAGDTILLEAGASVDRYHAPMMRCAVVGRPNATVARMADACQSALNAVIAAMAPGKTFHEVAAVGEALIAKAGPDMIFHHCFGYSVGLGFPPTWADAPLNVTLGDETLFEPGMAFHIPMSLRDEGRYGTAFGETVVITEAGCDVLTAVERRLRIVE